MSCNLLLRLAAIVSMVGGLTLAGDGLYIWSKAALGQALLQQSWGRTLRNSAPDKPWSWADMQSIAHMRLPDHDYEAVVLDGTHGEALAWGPGHMPGTPLPGEPGLSIIAGHRDTHFVVLADLSIGDVIQLTRFDSRQVTFRITSKHVVSATAPDLNLHSSAPRLALVTCWPLDAPISGGSDRLVIEAEMISANPVEQEQASL